MVLTTIEDLRFSISLSKNYSGFPKYFLSAHSHHKMGHNCIKQHEPGGPCSVIIIQTISIFGLTICAKNWWTLLRSYRCYSSTRGLDSNCSTSHSSDAIRQLEWVEQVKFLAFRQSTGTIRVSTNNKYRCQNDIIYKGFTSGMKM